MTEVSEVIISTILAECPYAGRARISCRFTKRLTISLKNHFYLKLYSVNYVNVKYNFKYIQNTYINHQIT
ncbi:hypothetical protein GCM10028810_11540 [Spirosoma litoris]